MHTFCTLYRTISFPNFKYFERNNEHNELKTLEGDILNPNRFIDLEINNKKKRRSSIKH